MRILLLLALIGFAFAQSCPLTDDDFASINVNAVKQACNSDDCEECVCATGISLSQLYAKVKTDEFCRNHGVFSACVGDYAFYMISVGAFNETTFSACRDYNSSSVPSCILDWYQTWQSNNCTVINFPNIPFLPPSPPFVAPNWPDEPSEPDAPALPNVPSYPPSPPFEPGLPPPQHPASPPPPLPPASPPLPPPQQPAPAYPSITPVAPPRYEPSSPSPQYLFPQPALPAQSSSATSAQRTNAFIVVLLAAVFMFLA